jgi:hypothetical protein
VSIAVVVVPFVLVFALGLYYFKVYRPAEKAFNKRKVLLNKRLNINSSIKKRKNSPYSFKTWYSNALRYWDKISKLSWHALQYITVSLSPYNNLKSWRTMNKFILMKWGAMNKPLVFQGTVVGEYDVCLDVCLDVEGTSKRDDQEDGVEKRGERDGRFITWQETSEIKLEFTTNPRGNPKFSSRVKSNINSESNHIPNRIHNPNPLPLVPLEIRNMINTNRKQLHMGLNDDVVSTLNDNQSSHSPKSIPIPNPNLKINMPSKNELIITNSDTTVTQRALNPIILFDPEQALFLLSTKLTFIPNPELSQGPLLSSNDTEDHDSHFKFFCRPNLVSNIYNPNCDSNPNCNPAPELNYASNLVSLDSLATALDSIWDVYYPDAIKMVHSETKEVGQLFLDWANVNPNTDRNSGVKVVSNEGGDCQNGVIESGDRILLESNHNSIPTVAVDNRLAQQLYDDKMQLKIKNGIGGQINNDKMLFKIPKPRRPSTPRRPSISNANPNPNSSPFPIDKLSNLNFLSVHNPSPSNPTSSPNPFDKFSDLNFPSIHNASPSQEEFLRSANYNDDVIIKIHHINPNRLLVHNPNNTVSFELFEIWFVNDLMKMIHSNKKRRLLDHILRTTPHVQQRIEENTPLLISDELKSKKNSRLKKGSIGSTTKEIGSLRPLSSYMQQGTNTHH